ncbi:thioredoxin-like [Rhinoraja longicauda]
MVVHELCSKDELSTKLKEAGNKLVVVDFSATWCQPCVGIKQSFDDLSTKYTDVIFCLMDVDEVSELTAEYEIKKVPTFIFIRDGEKVTSLEGAKVAPIEKKIQELTMMEQA